MPISLVVNKRQMFHVNARAATLNEAADNLRIDLPGSNGNALLGDI